MTYPQEFSAAARARIEAERLKGRRELERAKGQKPPNHWTTSRWDGIAFQVYILRVFRAFAHEACELGSERTWSVDRIQSEADEFLRRFTSEAYYEDGRNRNGEKFPNMISEWGSLLPKVAERFRTSAKWHQFEDELLRVAEQQAALEADTAISNAANRRAKIDAFLLNCRQEISVPITRKHIWRAAGHQTARQFQFWQAADGKATTQDDQNFRRILAMSPRDFANLLKKMGRI
jgi:hypothetical protein